MTGPALQIFAALGIVAVALAAGGFLGWLFSVLTLRHIRRGRR